MKVARVRRGPQPKLTSPFGVGGHAPMPALDDLSDVDLSSGVVDGDTIVFDDATDTWVPGTASSAVTTGSGFDVTPALSNAMPARVKPTGSGLITADAQGRLTIDSGSAYKAFPGMTFLEGRLHLVYRSGTDHDSQDGVIKYRTSDTLGRTWTSATTIASPLSGHDLRDPSIVALASGRLVMTYDDDVNGTAANIVIYAMFSDNRGQTWSSPYQVPATFSGEKAATSQALELPDGTILLPVFGDNGGNLQTAVMKSTDGGMTFPTQIAVASSGSRHYAELQIRLLASGTIVGLMRSDTNAHTWRTVSTDGGATWSSPTDVLALTGRPDFVEFFPSALIIFGRNNSTDNDPRWAVSWDEGVTWTSLAEVDTGVTTNAEYFAPVVLAPGYVAVAYALENSSTDADLYLRYYYDGYGVDTLGNIVGLSVSPGATFGTPALTLSTTNSAGAASTGIRTDATIATFDATVPVTQAFGDAAATGSAGVAARRDHVHGMPASPAATSMWVPVMTEDTSTNLWYVAVTGDGDAIMTEVPL